MTVNDEQRRAFTLLVENFGHGCVKLLLINAHDLSVETLDGLVQAGYASVSFDKILTEDGELKMPRM